MEKLKIKKDRAPAVLVENLKIKKTSAVARVKFFKYVVVVVVVVAIFWVFYIVNNVYFGVQMEIVRICETAKNDYVQGNKGEPPVAKPKELGFYPIIKKYVVGKWKKWKARRANAQRRDVPDDNVEE